MAGERYKDATYDTNRDYHYHSPDGDIIFQDGYSVMGSRKLTNTEVQTKKDVKRL